MKLNANWLGYENIHGNGKRSFQNNEKRQELLHSSLFLVKRNKNSSVEFSDLLVQEFQGLKLNSTEIGISSGSSQEPDFQDHKPSTTANDLKAVHFLNEYWA